MHVSRPLRPLGVDHFLVRIALGAQNYPPTAMLYASPHQFEPLLPQSAPGNLVDETRRVFELSHALRGALHPASLAAVRELVRSMNSYYSNRIEGRSTHPRNIDRALRSDFSAQPDVARRQRLAVAHIEAERELEAMSGGPMKETPAGLR